MKVGARQRRSWFLLIVGTLVLSLLACSLPIPFFDQEETPQPQPSPVQEQQIPELKVGDTVSAEGVEVFIPPETQDSQPTINVHAVAEPVPPAPEGSNTVGEAYEITSDAELTGPVLITLSYDPAELSPGVSEENLYLGTQVGDTWQVVPDGFVDTHDHTVSAPVDHFSIFGVLESIGEALCQYFVEDEFFDEIEHGILWIDLPQDIKDDLYENQVPTLGVTGIVHMRLSKTTVEASAMLSFANLLSRATNLALGVADGSDEALARALKLTAASEALRGNQPGSFVLTMYESADLGWDIGTYAVDHTQGDPATLMARAAAWLLDKQMNWINRNIDKAFEDLWTYNFFSLNRLELYALFVTAEPWTESTGAKGWRFYYYDENRSTWINYYNNMAYWKAEFEPEEQQEGAPEPAVTASPPATTPTPRPASTATPRPTSTSLPTYTPSPTPTTTSAPTATPSPSPTLTPTRTPTLTPSPTPTPRSEPPVITSIDFPSRMPCDGTKTRGLVWFRDPDGDVDWVEIETLSASVHFTGGAWSPTLVEGTSTDGAYEFFAWAGEGQKYDQHVSQQIILYDEAGNSSGPYRFSFYCYR